MLRRLTTSLFTLIAAASCVSSARATTVESLGDASIAHDTNSDAWTITAGGAAMALSIGPSTDYTVTSLVSPSGTQWLAAPHADATVTVSGTALVFGSRADGFTYASTSTRTNGRRLELAASYVVASLNLNVTRHVAVAPGSPTFEVWTTFQALGSPVALSNLGALDAIVAPGTIHWVTGEQPRQGDPAPLDSEFETQARLLATGQSVGFGSTTRSSEAVVPWLAVDGAADELYVALMWSGAWFASATRTDAGLSLQWGLGSMATVAASAVVEGPHALVGVAATGRPGAAAALRTYVLQGLRDARPITPLVTYNTWFAYGTAVDEASMQREMARASAMGVELFVVDAGWYAGADTKNTTDFTPGLGSWAVDADRFPDGLGSLSDFAHSLGMKFGVWVEPERIDISLAGQNGLSESALATQGGEYGADDSAMICLAGAAGRQWVLDHLTAFIDSVHPDYLKWDNNLWVNCDRDGHGHGKSDGNFAQVTALYGILDTLRQRYPSLLIENCAGGGNRLDFGMLRYTDTAWMDDQSAPSLRVRHNFEGLTQIFPPAYLLSFLTELGWEPLHNSPDLPLYARSRMPGAFGLSIRSLWLTDGDVAALTKQINFYKRLRPLVAASAGTLLTAQGNGQETDWDVLQETGVNGGVALFAFNGAAAPATTTVMPAGLQPETRYQVVSIDGSTAGMLTGADMMTNGLALMRSPVTAAQILLLIPQR